MSETSLQDAAKTVEVEKTSSQASFIELARSVLRIEADAIEALFERLQQDTDASEQFTQACCLLLDCQGHIVVLGMGKSGHISGKIAATLASTGSPAFFVHPAEASHGDLGMITSRDVILALSNSGETDEIRAILPLITRLQVPLIALTGNARSTLARAATVHIDVSVEQEACPLGLAPTASTTAALAMGDALAVALLDARGFTSDDFARSHPGGKLGRRLLLRVQDVMHSGTAVPRNSPDDNVHEALLEMSAKQLGMTVIVDAQQYVLGVFADGDLRRALEQPLDIYCTRVGDLMSSPCHTIGPEVLAAEAVNQMEDKQIFMLPVVDQQQRLIGAFNMHDLLRAGVV